MAKAYKAKWIIPSDGSIYEDCALIVDEGKVQEIVKQETIEEDKFDIVRDFKNALITPGFVNLHSHLQYTDLKAKNKNLKAKFKKLYTILKKHYFLTGISKKSFIFRLANLLSDYFCMTRDEKIASFEKGIELSLLNGTTAVAQLSRETKYFEVLNKSPLKTYLFFELFSDSVDSSKEEFRAIKKKIDKLKMQKSENTFVGVAPHSVCCVHKRLFKILVKYCKKHNILMTIRLAESKEEMDWLKHGFSDVDLLNEFTNHKKFEPAEIGLTPAQYLEQLGVLSKQLIISYGNYLPVSDLELLNAQKVALAYCPRISDSLHDKKLSLDFVTQYFQSRFGFGLNSLAFNKDLSLLNELKYANNGQLDVLEAIKYLTIIPAKILRLNNIIGSLEVDKDADFNVFELEDGEDYNAILNKERPNHVYIKAKRVVKNSKMNI
ncbi:MAG: amidohydrolase family protein [Candidatus Gastranaerophilales bacterium]|nr:amidohydrolase family protein [Candidatus Gastranaerophilales bacterium]